MNWGDLEDEAKIKSPPIPRKKKAAANTAGHKRGNIIKPPTEVNLDDIYGDDSPSRRPRSRENYRGDGSDSSRFSVDPCIDGESTKRDERPRRQQRQDSDRKKSQKQDRNEKERRHRHEQKLIEMQRKKDSQQPECIDIDIDDDNRNSSPAKSTFDGVRTDRVTNVEHVEYVNSVKEMYPGNDNDDSVEVGEDRGKTSKRNKKKRRGRDHERSSMVVGSTPRNRDYQTHHNQGGRRIQDDVLNQSFTSDDPLDQARQEQATNRPRSSSKARSNPFSDLHPNKTKTPKNTNEGGNGLWDNVASSARKCVDGVKECVKQLASSPGKARRGKSDSMTQRMGRNMKLLGDGNIESKHERRRRKRCAEAAQSRQERGEKQPTSGEKRKREDTNDAIELDQSVCAVDESQEMRGSNNIDEEELEIVGAIEGASTRVSQADYEHLPTAKRYNPLGLARAPAPEKKNSRNDGKRKEKAYGGAARKVPISNFASHMKTQRKVGEDEIVDKAEGRASRACSKSRGRSPVAAHTDSQGWISRNEKNVPEKSSSRTRSSRLEDKAKKQGMRFDDGVGSSKGKGQQKKGKGMHQTKLSLTPSSRNTRRRSRSKSQQPRDPKDDIIEIDDSSEEEDDMSVNEPTDVAESIGEEKPEHQWAPGDRRAVDAVNIAIGKKMVTSKCEVSVQTSTRHPYIQFSGVDPKGNNISHKVLLNNEELKEIKYFIANDETNEDADESLTMIAFRITPTEKNGFTYYPNKYHQDDSEDEDKIDKYYVSVEVRDPDALFAFVTAMEEHPTLKIFCEDAKVHSYEVPKYAQALIDHQRQERNARLSIAGRTRSGGNKETKKKISDNKLLLVYPFGVDESILSEAASELTELGGDLLGVKGARHSAAVSPGNEDNDHSDGGGEDSDEKKGKSSRTHYVTIREDDVERLSPGQFLNDTLVDFWMRWISRGEPADSNVHFFTSHFMTTLKEDGPEAVASWTAKKKINIFEKKFIFIPVNADLHWSLCVVVNPGSIANMYDEDGSTQEDHACILFLDSLRMHSKNVYARHIRKWLNFEWKHHKKGKIKGSTDPSGPFDKHIVLRSPKIPYQENGCDCGVFVCRYAYSLYTMRHLKFTYDDIVDKPGFRSLITKGPAFQFDMSDIARIRDEIGTLIDNLSKHYLKMKEEEKKQERAKKAKRRENANVKSIKQESTSENQSKRTTTASAEANVDRGKTETTPETEKNASPPLETETSAMSTTTEAGGASSDTAMSTSDVDNGSPDTADEANSQKDADGDVRMTSSEGKENIVNQDNQDESHDDSTRDGVSTQKLASDQQGMDEEPIHSTVTSPLL